MASGIPTRRAIRRIDENAPPSQPTTIATRSRTAGNPATGTAAAPTGIPVMKRTASSQGAASNVPSRDVKTGVSTATGATGGIAGDGKKVAVTRRRAALGELPVTTKTASKDVKPTVQGKAGAVAERRPLASTSTTQEQQKPNTTAATTTTTTRRVTRSTVAAASEARAGDTRSAAVKRKVGPSGRARPALSRHTSAASHASTSTNASGASTSTVRTSRQLQPTASLPDAGPAPKRLRASSTTSDEVVQFEEEHREAVHVEPESLTTVRAGPSPKRKAKDAGWTDLDAEDRDDPTMVSEYVVDAFKYMMEIEKVTMPAPDYMDHQEELQWKMRGILNDWIVEVHAKFRLLPETLFVAVNLIDRFLTERLVSLVKLQLVGLTALFVAAKYEEVICPSVTHLLHMADGGYGTDEILRAERYLLTTLKFDLSYPNPLHFLRRVSKADGYDVHTRTVAKFFIEISCLEHRLLPYPPSMLAAAAMWLARYFLERGPWHANMVHYSGYAQHEVLPCAQIMLNYVVDPQLDTSTAFFKKYATRKHLKAAIFVQDWAQKRFPEAAEGEMPDLAAEFGGEEQAPSPTWR